MPAVTMLAEGAHDDGLLLLFKTFDQAELLELLVGERRPQPL